MARLFFKPSASSVATMRRGSTEYALLTTDDGSRARWKLLDEVHAISWGFTLGEMI